MKQDEEDIVTEDRGWQLDLAGARNYERFLVPALMDPWAERLVRSIATRPGQRVLDVACGTGIVARHAAAAVGPTGSVTGVDINAAMLTVAREVTLGLNGDLHWHEASAERLPFADATFDVALCQQGLQFFEDRTSALAELHRVVAPGGHVGLATCRSIERQPGYFALAAIVTDHLGVDAGAIIRSPYVLGEPDELRRLVEKAGFRDVTVRIDITPMRVPDARALLEGETVSSPLGDIVERLDPDVVDAIVDDLSGALAPHRDDEGIVFPFETLVVTANR